MALALPLTTCGELFEDEACLERPSDGTCPTPKQAEKQLLGKGCGYKTISVDGEAILKIPTPGGYAAEEYTTAEYAFTESRTEPRTEPGTNTEQNAEAMDDLACCYPVTRRDNPRDGCVVGRPFLAENGELQRATLRRSPAWLNKILPQLKGLSAHERERLATAWVEIAMGEHASIAAFSKLSLELLHFGAPAPLVEACHQAALDEVEHARGAFALASAYAGENLGPGILDMGNKVALAESYAAMALAVAHEGCRDETLSTLVAAESIRLVHDPVVRWFLEQVVRDETRHAAFSWRLLQWTLRVAPTDPTIMEEIDEILLADSSSTPSMNLESPFAHHGILGESQIARIQKRGRDEIIRPCWQQLRAA